MAQFCESCGAPLNEGDKFCEQCGQAVPAAPAPAVNQPAREETPAEKKHPEKNPVLALILSFIFSGLGQVYNGETLKGAAILVGTVIGYFIFVIPGVIVLIYGMYDAYTTAKKMNEGTVAYKESNAMFMIGFVVLVLVVWGVVFAAVMGL